MVAPVATRRHALVIRTGALQGNNDSLGYLNHLSRKLQNAIKHCLRMHLYPLLGLAIIEVCTSSGPATVVRVKSLMRALNNKGYLWRYPVQYNRGGMRRPPSLALAKYVMHSGTRTIHTGTVLVSGGYDCEWASRGDYLSKRAEIIKQSLFPH